MGLLEIESIAANLEHNERLKLEVNVKFNSLIMVVKRMPFVETFTSLSEMIASSSCVMFSTTSETRVPVEHMSRRLRAIAAKKVTI